LDYLCMFIGILYKIKWWKMITTNQMKMMNVLILFPNHMITAYYEDDEMDSIHVN